MNINEIKEIVNSDLPNDYKEKSILFILSKDKNVIPYLLYILERERETNKELILDSNLELSRALVTLNMNQKPKKAAEEQRVFVIDEIKKHYMKWKDKIKCNFNIQGLP